MLKLDLLVKFKDTTGNDVKLELLTDEYKVIDQIRDILHLHPNAGILITKGE